jgi:mannan endo-1,4-beta-mannosidase
MPTYFRFRGGRVWRAALFLIGFAALAWGQSGFVQRSSNGTLTLNGLPFRFGGTNSYPLMYSPTQTVDQVLGTVVNSNLRVVRMWVFCETTCGNGFYLQSFPTGASAPVYNDSPTSGLVNIDYVVSAANRLGVKLIMTLANNWHDFGGMDQYVRWRAGPQYHDQFYTDATIRQWYKNWISHVLNHVNTYSNVAYKDDPTIMAWELANEPECGNDGLPTSGNCTNQTIISWITDAAEYIKGIDSNHLVSVGDEGFFCEPGTTDYFTDCANGVDSKGFSSVQNIDLVGLHLYPDSWGKSIAWSETYITDHVTEANSLVKPLYMGEFGLLSGNAKEFIYNDWTNLIFNGGVSGAMFWDILPGTPAPSAAESASAFDEEAGSPVFFLMSDFAQLMAGSTQPLPPVAGYQWASTFGGQPATLNVLSNDVAYGGATIDPTTIDLDPNTPDQQTSFAVTGGVFNVVGQSVEFTPQASFTGSVTGSYTVEDSNHQLSNVGYLLVTVNPALRGWTTLDSFESGSDGWGPLPANVPPVTGTVATSTIFHTDGSYSLQVNVTAGGWFGATLPNPVDLSNWPSLAVDVEATSVGGSSAFAFTSGTGAVWCQNTNATWQTLALFSTTTLTVPLQPSQLTCYGGTPDLTSVRALYIYFGNPGTYYVDNLRAAPGSAGSAPLPTISGVGNSAGGQAGVSAGTYISIYGSNFAPTGWPTSIWSDYVFGGQLPTKLAGVSVSMGGMPAYIEYLSPTQINVLAPNLGTGSISVTVTTPAGTSTPYPINSTSVQPAFFEWSGNQVVATDANYNWLVRSGTFPGTTTVPAKPGETVILWGTGFGPTTPAAPAGQVVPAQTYSVNGVVVTVGTIPVQATTALSLNWSADCRCYTAAGVYQIVITVPSTLANGDYPIFATVDGVQSPSGVNLTVQQ